MCRSERWTPISARAFILVIKIIIDRHSVFSFSKSSLKFLYILNKLERPENFE